MMSVRDFLSTFFRDQSGGATAWSLFSILTMLMIGGLSVDYANGVRVRAQLQAAADATALAAVLELPDDTKALDEGLSIAGTYFGENDGQAIRASDFVFGRIDPASGAFMAGSTPYNAVRVFAARQHSRGNAVGTFLMALVGLKSLDVHAEAIARGRGDLSCRSGGFFADGRVISGSNNDYLNSFCLYGKSGVKIGSNNTFDPTVSIEMQNSGDFDQGSDNVGAVPTEKTYTLQLPDQVSGIVDDMNAGVMDSLPPYITDGPVYLTEITDATPLTSGTLYIVEFVADLGSDRMLSNVAIVAGKEIKLGSNNTIENVVFASMDKLLIGSTNSFGSPNYCDAGVFNTYLFGGSNIEFGSLNYLRGLQMAARGDIKLGSDVAGLEGVYAETLLNFDYGSADVFGGCEAGLNSEMGTPVAGSEGPYNRFALVR